MPVWLIGVKHWTCITALYLCTSQQAAGALWRLLVGSAQLADHLAALRKYFLLGAGDFWHAFLLQVSPPDAKVFVTRCMYFATSACSAHLTDLFCQ